MGSRSFFAVSVLGAVLGVGGAGCSSAGSGGASAEGGSPGSTEDSSTPSASGGSSSGGSDGAIPDSSSDAGTDSPSYADAALVGWVFITEDKNTIDSMHTYGFTAQFPRPFETPLSLCDIGRTVGSCCLWGSALGVPDAGAPPTYVSAGDITLRDMATTLATLSFSASSGYAGANTSTLVWAPGDTLSASAVGASVGAFSGTVAAPSIVSGLTPSLTTPVARASDWTLAWTPDTGSAGGTVNLTVYGSDVQFGCTAEDSAGQLTVPSSVLMNFATGTQSASLERVQTVRSSNGQVEIEATAEIDSRVTFQ